ncbi:MAG: serine--tRNA ligase, partial [Candidatus Aminicenantes bacterium]|nr:serine--tRNA ligase [Candidatus Aminicenantes bacterium]
MLDPKYVLENIDSVVNRLADRGERPNLDDFVKSSERKRGVLRRVEDLRAERNRASETISRLKREGQDAGALILEMRKVGDEIAGLEEELKG